jgi:hypothetical protein
MARKQAAGAKRSNAATIEEILTLARRVSELTIDPLETKDYVGAEKGSEAWNLWDAVESLLIAIYFLLPAKDPDLLTRLVHAESLNLMGCCEVTREMFEDSDAYRDSELKIALIKMHVAASRFIIMAR